MKKKKLILFTIASVAASMLTGINGYAASRAYSVGTKWPAGTYQAGSDFTVNVMNASNAYGWLDGYTSYYSTEPTYSYMKGSRLGTSQVYFINGHASPFRIDVVSKDENNYRTGISIYGDGDGICDATKDEWIYAGLDGRSMSGTKLITFAGCQTGKGTTNLVKKAVAQGAKSSVGFKENVTSRFGDGPKWMQKYNNLLGNGNTVQKSITSAVAAYPNCDLSDYVIASGATSTKLGILSTTSVNYINNLRIIASEERESLKPFEELHVILDVKDRININLNENSKLSSIDNVSTNFNDSIVNIVENIKNYDSSFDLDEYKITYNLVNESEGYGFIFFTYFIDNIIETNKVYLVEIMNNKVEKIILSGVKESNVGNIDNMDINELTNKVLNFNLTKKEEKLNKKVSNLFNTQNILTEESTIDANQLNEDVKEYNEKYYYDYNTKELSYMLTTYLESANQTFDGELFKVIIE